MSNTEYPAQKACWHCKAQIPNDAIICKDCKSYQNWQRHFSTANMIAVALVAVFSLIGITWGGVDYFMTLCCTRNHDLRFSMVQPLTLSDYQIERRLQIAKVSGKIAVINKGKKDASINAALVEHISGTQTYFLEGCGYQEIPNPVIKSGGGLVVIPFEMRYWVLLNEQLAPFEDIFKRDNFNTYMSGAGMDEKDNVRDSGNVLVLWTDGDGGRRQTIVQGQFSGQRAIKYKGTEAEFKAGGLENPYCFSEQARKRLGIDDDSSLGK